ncbi:hypothetical protein KC845_02550 [Candidatus Kaiserbacteria bacterium]|nr:hypothetical protein [Candidatus Kaiserbacteria bacterium]
MHPYIDIGGIRVLFTLEEYYEKSISIIVYVFDEDSVLLARADVLILYDRVKNRYVTPIFEKLDFYEPDLMKRALLHDSIMSSLVLFLGHFGYEEKITVMINNGYGVSVMTEIKA